MKIKTFTARTFAEALVLVKKELSQDAIILSTEEKKGLRPSVVVTAAIDYDALSEPGSGQAEGLGGNKRGTVVGETIGERAQTAHGLHPAPYGRTTPRDGSVDELRNEVGSLRTMLEGMKNSGYEMSLPANKKAVLNFLTDRAVRHEYALRLCDRTADLGEVPLMLSADIRVKRHSGTKKAVMLIGPTGVGKTTTIAKLAAQAVKAGKKAAIINLDTYRIGATEQARIYARILGIPLATAANTAEFRTSLLKFSETRDVVFVDTTGRNPRDEAYINNLAETCKTDIPLELHLLMNANGDDACMIDACKSYQKLPIDYIAFTKIDEAVRYGALYNLLITYQKPVAYITTGQRVPHDIEFPSVSRLASLIVRRECAA